MRFFELAINIIVFCAVMCNIQPDDFYLNLRRICISKKNQKNKTHIKWCGSFFFFSFFLFNCSANQHQMENKMSWKLLKRNNYTTQQDKRQMN